MSRRPDGISESIRIRVHPGLCEAWGNCHRWAPHIYPLDADGKVDVHVIEGANHVLSLRQWQQQLLDLSSAWMRRHFASDCT